MNEIDKLLEELESIDISTYNPREKVLRDRISEIRLSEREGAKKAYTKVAKSTIQKNKIGSSCHGSVVTNLTSIHEDAGSIPSLDK